MRESRTFGSVRGVPGNGHPYRDNGATARLLGHRQTKGAATDKPDLLPPRHIPTLPGPGFPSVRRKLTLAARVLAPKVGFLASPRIHTGGHNRSHREPKDRAATDRFRRYCGHRPSSVPWIEIPKAATRCLSMPKIRRPSAAHDIEWAQPTQSRPLVFPKAARRSASAFRVSHLRSSRS